MTGRLIYGDVSYSTADVERTLFAGERQPLRVVTYLDNSPTPIPPGEYRVIDGELFELVDDSSIDREPEATKPL